MVIAVASVVIVLGLVFAVTVRGGQSRETQWLSSEQPARTTPNTPSFSTAAPAPTTRRTLTVDSGCHPGQGPAALDPVADATTRRVGAAWDRIERWLKAKAPASAASLRPPATTAEVIETQKMIGVALPAELVASLLRHDGATGRGDGFTLPPFYAPVSTANIATEAKTLCEALVSIGVDESVGSWWHGKFVPFAADGSGNTLFLDQRTGTARLGASDHEGGVDFARWPGSLTELLEQTATALETGGAVVGGYRPVVTENRALEWDFRR